MSNFSQFENCTLKSSKAVNCHKPCDAPCDAISSEWKWMLKKLNTIDSIIVKNFNVSRKRDNFVLNRE